MEPVGIAEVAVLPVERDADEAALGRHEGLDVRGVRLGDGARAVDVVVRDDQDAAALRLRVSGHRYRVVQGQPAVEAP